MNINPRLIVVMGVSGSGKSTLAKALSAHLKFLFMEADDFHLPSSIDKMASGIPLDEGDRAPWINAMCHFLTKEPHDTVLAYSGLKKNHRVRFRQLGYKIHFIYLRGNVQSLQTRLQNRDNHFMAQSLLESQLQAMEAPDNESDITPMDIDDFTDLDASITFIKQTLFYQQQSEQHKVYE